MADSNPTSEKAVSEAVAQTSLDAIIVADDRGLVQAFNPAAEAMFGYSRAEALGRSIGELIVPDHHRAAHDAGMNRYMAGAPARVLGRRMEMEARKRDGTVFPVELAITESRTAEGRFFAASLRDLTERQALAQAQQSTEAFLRALVEDQTDLVVRTGVDGGIIFCNAATARFFGTTVEALIGKPHVSVATPGDAQELDATLTALTPDAPVRRVVKPAAGPQGDMRWLAWTDRALFDAQGQHMGYLSVARDVTEERRAREALERSKEENALYRRMFEAMSDTVYIKDREGRFVLGNAALSQALGLPSPDNLVGLADTDLHPPEVAEAYRAVEETLYASGKDSQLAIQRVWQTDGTLAWQETLKTVFRDENGIVIGLIGHGRDVTEQVRAEHALAQSEARFAAFVDNAPIAMFLKDEAGRYVLLNQQAATVIGMPIEQILGKTAREVGTPGSADQTEAADRAVRASMRPVQTEGPLMSEGDRYRQAMILRFPVPAPEGEGVWIGGFAIDLTQQKEGEAALERSRDALRQSEKMTAMGSLLAGVAHELNNPLAIVMAQATLLSDDAEGTAYGTRADKIKRAAERCGRIVQTFLGLARSKPAERTRCSLNQMTRAAADLMAYPLRTAGVEVVLDLGADLPEVEGDADLLGQVVLNLLINAQQALERSPAPRLVRLTTRAQAGQVVLEVQDNGPGVPANIRDRIFEPFFSTKPTGIGTGVGLSFCHNVVLAHGGTIELADDKRGHGAMFRVCLPVALGVVPVVTVPGPEPLPARLRALVVDDEADLGEVLAEMLVAEGFHADQATSAVEAQEFARTGSYDVVLSDLRMPGMDGPALYAWLKEVRPDLAARTVFVTGDALGVSAAQFLAEAGRPVIEKPFTRDDLREVISGVLPARLG
jgi:PAS domain S-box-containing protein